MTQPLRKWPALALIAALAGTDAAAGERCDPEKLRHNPPTANFRVDNDLFGGKAQDQGYSNGAMLTLVSPNLVDFTDDPCLPRLARWINRRLERLHPGEFEQQNMVFGIGQGIFTPTDHARSDAIEDDRPYAAVALVSFGYNARDGERLRTTHLRLGIVGPSARGEEVQRAVHKLIGAERFNGWAHQLHDEPVAQLVHERMRRTAFDGDAEGWGWDGIAHWGGSLGNLATYANAGAEWRFGWRLPDDFGSSPLRPAGENTAPPRDGYGNGRWAGHVFLSMDARWVLRDITLDSNTFRDSHSVDKRPFVADVGYGVAITRGRWKFALARYYRSREFEGQRENPVFGSFTVSYKL